jgi:hypothetical protein
MKLEPAAVKSRHALDGRRRAHTQLPQQQRGVQFLYFYHFIFALFLEQTKYGSVIDLLALILGLPFFSSSSRCRAHKNNIIQQQQQIQSSTTTAERKRKRRYLINSLYIYTNTHTHTLEEQRRAEQLHTNNRLFFSIV